MIATVTVSLSRQGACFIIEVGRGMEIIESN